MRSHLLRLYPDAVTILHQMGEPMAAGFYEAVAEGLPWPRPFGRAFRRFYEAMPLRLSETGLLAPDEPITGGIWPATGFLVDFQYSVGLQINVHLVPDRKEKFSQHATFIDDVLSDMRSHLPTFGGYTHANPDFRRVVNEGFDAMERDLDAEIALVAAQGDAANADERELLAAVKEYAIGARAFHTRTAALLRQAAAAASGPRKAELERMAAEFATTFVQPARTFYQGMLAVRVTWFLDGCDNLGRLDQVLGDLYEADIRSGAISVELARRLIDELYHDMARFHGWNMQIGGYANVAWASRPCQPGHENKTSPLPRQNESETLSRRMGETPMPRLRDGCNALTRELLVACGRNKIRKPNMAFRITSHTPPELVRLAIELIRDGSGGRPALYNDDLYVRTLRGLSEELGFREEDVHDITFGGCTETMIGGMSNVGSTEGDINWAKVLELTLHDGLDPLTGLQAGPHTGRLADMPDFAAFLAAVKRQIQYATDDFVARDRVALAARFGQGDPKLYRTFFTRDCVTRRKSFESGGARYNWAQVNSAGTANLIDSVAAVRKCVFDDRSISPAELLEALRADFVGHEEALRRLSAAPKFGNDDPYVDDIGCELMTFAWTELFRHEIPRGGRYVNSCIMFQTFGDHGRQVGALPDGRRARTVTADSVGPIAGRDTHGPTAMLKSVTKLPLTLAFGTPVLNLRLQREFLESPTGIDACVNMLRAYFDMGGMQLQINVVSKAQLQAAQAKPETHDDLLVRVGGFSEHFVRLPRDLQDNIIARTEHGSP